MRGIRRLIRFGARSAAAGVLVLTLSGSAEARRTEQPRIYGQHVTEGCDAPAGDVCEVDGSAATSGVIAGYSRYETLGAPSLNSVWGYGGGAHRATHRIPAGATKVVYRALWEVVPYDDPRTAEREQRGVETASTGAVTAQFNGAIDVQPPGCNNSGCSIWQVDNFANSRLGPATLAPGARRTVELTLTAPAGGALQRGTAYLNARLYPGVGTRLRVTGSTGEASGAAKLVSLTAEVTY